MADHPVRDRAAASDLSTAAWTLSRLFCSALAELCASPCNSSDMLSMSIRSYQMSSSRFVAKSAMADRYSVAVDFVQDRATVLDRPLARAARTTDVVSRFTSHSKGPGFVSSKSLTSKITDRSGAANMPKFARCASPQSCALSPVRGMSERSEAMMIALPR